MMGESVPVKRVSSTVRGKSSKRLRSLRAI
jgi:hypothetical protein